MAVAHSHQVCMHAWSCMFMGLPFETGRYHLQVVLIIGHAGFGVSTGMSSECRWIGISLSFNYLGGDFNNIALN